MSHKSFTGHVLTPGTPTVRLPELPVDMYGEILLPYTPEQPVYPAPHETAWQAPLIQGPQPSQFVPPQQPAMQQPVIMMQPARRRGGFITGLFIGLLILVAWNALSGNLSVTPVETVAEKTVPPKSAPTSRPATGRESAGSSNPDSNQPVQPARPTAAPVEPTQRPAEPTPEPAIVPADLAANDRPMFAVESTQPPAPTMPAPTATPHAGGVDIGGSVHVGSDGVTVTSGASITNKSTPAPATPATSAWGAGSQSGGDW